MDDNGNITSHSRPAWSDDMESDLVASAILALVTAGQTWKHPDSVLRPHAKGLNTRTKNKLTKTMCKDADTLLAPSLGLLTASSRTASKHVLKFTGVIVDDVYLQPTMSCTANQFVDIEARLEEEYCEMQVAALVRGDRDFAVGDNKYSWSEFDGDLQPVVLGPEALSFRQKGAFHSPRQECISKFRVF